MIIGGKYKVIRVVGQGRASIAYKCDHLEFPGHVVTLRIFPPSAFRERFLPDRIRDEILAAYAVSHPNVVRTYDYIADETLIGYCCEYVDGVDLATWITKQRGGSSIETIFEVLSQISSGLQAIHEAGIVHQALAPQSVLMMKGDVPKITDVAAAETRWMTRFPLLEQSVGPFDHVSPEQLLGGQVDHRSDIYALGILAYEMITGRSPFSGDSVCKRLTARLEADPPPPSKHQHDCPPELDQVILQAMRRDPGQRFASAREMWCELSNARIISSRRMRPMIRRTGTTG